MRFPDPPRRTGVAADPVGACRNTGQLDNVQVWFAAPLQDQICRRVPLAELGPVASRHLPEPVLTRLPLAPTVHACAAVPLQSYSWIFVPLAVPAEVTSMHLPSACSVLPLCVQFCAVVPLQV
jgi:hypothetical protein